MLVEAGGNSAIMLDTIEEPLDAVAQLVDPWAEGGRVGAMVQRTNVGRGTLGRNLCPKRVAVVAAIRQQDALARKRAEHVFATLAVVGLTFGQLQRDREPVRIDDGVDFGRKPAAGTSHATTTAAFFSPLAAC